MSKLRISPNDGAFGLLCRLRHLANHQGGNIAISAAVSLPLVVGSLALAVDYGNLTLQRRAAQNTVDLAAIVATSAIADPEAAVAAFLHDNGLDYVIATEQGYLAPDGSHSMTPQAAGILSIDTGQYLADASLRVSERYVPTGTPANAARVSLALEGTLHFASLFATPPRLAVVGTAHAQKRAAFSIGSRLASLKDGILNEVLGGLRSSLELSVMDYDALLDADVAIFPLMDAIATELDLTAVTYDDLLQEEMSIGALSNALAASGALSAAAEQALSTIGAADDGVMIPLAQFFDPGPYGALDIGTDPGLTVMASALDFLSAAGALANGGNQIALDLDLELPGILAVTGSLAVGEPPQDSSWIAVGETGATVRTAQTRLMLDVQVGGGGIIPGIHLPLYVEVAAGEATVADIACHSGTRDASVSLDARPGIVEASIGEIDPSKFLDFSRSPTVARAKLVDLGVIKVKGSAHFEATNMVPDRVTFTPQEIGNSTIKSVSTRNPLQSLAASLVGRLDLKVELGLLSLLTPQAIMQLVGNLLEGVTAPLDSIIYNALLAVGVKVGEADLRVTGAACGQVALVQ